MTPLKTQTQHIDSTAVLQVEKTSDELDLTEDPFIPKAQLFNSPSSIGKLESAESKQDVSAPEAQYNTPVNNPDLNVKSIRSKGQHLNSSPTENTEVSIDDLNVDQLKTEAQLSSAGGKFDTECKEVRITLCSSSSQLLSSSGSEQKSHLNENSDRVQNTLEGSLVDEIQKFSIQDTNTPVKNITQIHDPLENQAVESQLITEMSSSASNKLEVNHVMYPCATQKIQEETVTSSTPTSNCQARDEQIIAKGLMKSKDPSSLSSQKVKNCGAIQPDIGKMLEDKNEIVIEDPNMSKNSGDQISTKASILAPTLQTKSPQITSDTNISINPLNLKTQLINTPSANNLTSCNSNNSKSSYDQENYFSIESSNASSFNLTIQEIAMSPEDKDTEQKVSNVEPLKDESDKAHAQEDMVTAVTDKPFIVNHDKESFPKHSAAHESIPNTPKIKTSRNDDVTKAKDESIPFSPQEPDIAENELFIPATEAFNDPAFFDMLEHTSSGKAPNSKRGSVLLKFDPLQDRRDSLASKSLNTSPDTIIQGQAQKPGRMSDVFKDSKLGISFIDESVCLFGTPPRVARRRTLTRRVHNYRAQSIEEENSSNEVDMIFGLDNEGDGMDTIINDNLHPMNEGPRLVDIGEMPVYTESDLKQIRADLTMHFQELMLKKDREFQEKLKEQGQLAELEKEKFKTETNGLNQKIKSLHGKLKSLNDVMKGYTEIISQLTVEKEKAQLEVEKVTVDLSELQKYNSQVIEDNKTLEKSFDDLFHRYEKLKQTLEKAAENEKVLKQAVQSAQEKYKSIKETARKIKEVAEAKIAEQDEKYEKLSSSTKSELTRLEASLKMKDMQVQGLENTLEQKRKENKELTDLCDSLINKVSSK
ncbi:unnamed protein product [Lymnaea stagnalis]|uniref:Transforming acidic coiled-coil-containing protein C-terminal domain-containing protein n=1 Tax=Lymnaea stagnalis TaxID=6523 RepID=A0AAV2H3H0_LYMST